LVVDVALFVSKRLMPVAAALLLLASVRLACSLETAFSTSSSAAASPAAAATEVRVVIAH